MTTLWVKLVAAAAIIAVASWGVHLYNQSIRDDQRAKDVAEYNEARAIAAQEAAIETAAMLGAKENAINARIESEKKTRAALSAARTESGRLRDTIADLRAGMPDVSLEACRARADAGLRLLGACQERYLEVAAGAKGHLEDSLMYQRGWPNKHD